MALKFAESFDGVSTLTQFLNNKTSDDESGSGKWINPQSSIPTAGWSFVAGRNNNGLKSLAVQDTVNNDFYSQRLAFGTTIFIGIGLEPGDVASERCIWTIYNDVAGGTPGNRACFITRLDNAIKVYTVDTNGNATARITSAAYLTTSNYVYIEVKLVFGSSGQVELRLDGKPMGVVSGIDTRGAGASTQYDRIQIGRNPLFSRGLNDIYDDLYVCNWVGSRNNSYLGPQALRRPIPGGNGNSTQWVGSDGDSIDNYALVDEVSRDDADYVQSTNDGDKDTYVFTDVIGLAAYLSGVQLVAQSSRVGGGTKNMSFVARLSATEATASPTQTMDANLREHCAVFETKPGGNSWSQADVNNAEFGYQQTA